MISATYVLCKYESEEGKSEDSSEDKEIRDDEDIRKEE
jgi:hypothetical protein